jgi:hypothetical protein
VEVQEMMLKTLNESIAVPGKMLCMLHPWDAPVPLTRVWCLWELHCAIKLGAEVIMCFSSGQAKEFYERLKQLQLQQQAGGMSTKGEGLVPTIDVRKAQATKEEDRVRIFTEIEDTVGIERFNAQLQDFMEAALQEEARTALITAAAGSIQDSKERVTLAAVHEEVQQAKELARAGMAELASKQEAGMKELASKQEAGMKELASKQEAGMAELVSKQEAGTSKQEAGMKEMNTRMASLEAKLDTLLARL